MAPQVQQSATGSNGKDVRDRVSRYLKFHDEGNVAGESERLSGYQEMVTGYYDLATEFYERGWGRSFHFAVRHGREPFDASLKRHEHFIAARLGLTAGMKVLDVGCGVGGPMREIARFSGAHVTGVNNNATQVEKARRYNQEEGLEAQCEVLQADFMQIPLPDASMDAIYGIEATCHAPDKTALFSELRRVLKPGGLLAVYEWCLTERFDRTNQGHQDIKRDIQEGNGLPHIWTVDETRRCFEDAGLEVLDAQDKACEGNPKTPWHHALAGRELSFVGVQRSPVGRRMSRALVVTLEQMGVAPRGSRDVSDFLNVGADALVAGGDTGCFTPMAYFLACKA